MASNNFHIAAQPTINGYLGEEPTEGNLTARVIALNSHPKTNPRVLFLLSKLVQHLHSFVRESELQIDEWEATWQYLTKVGQACTPVRQEFILLSDVLGVSALIEALSNRSISGATESSVLGPFHSDASEFIGNGGSINSHDEAGEALLIRGTVHDTAGRPVEGALIDIWETDSNGLYDLQDPNKEGPDCRGKFVSRTDGTFFLRGVKPVDYPVPVDGPVGDLLRLLNRDSYRPSHVHFILTHPEFEKLVTAVYPRESKFIAVDPVFGVKASLIVDFAWIEDEALAQEYSIKMFTREIDGLSRRGFWLLDQSFVLVPTRPLPERKTHD